MDLISDFYNVNYITVPITAGQRGFHFSKYFLLGSTGTHTVKNNNGGCPFLREP